MNAKDIQETSRRLAIDVYLLGIAEKKEAFEKLFIKIWMTISELKEQIKKL